MFARATLAILATGRLALGLGLLAAPGRFARGWIGDDADRPLAQLLVRSIGARDAGIGAGQLLALMRGAGARPWFDAGIAADVADLAGTLVAWRHMPPQGRIATLVMATAAAAIAARFRPALDSTPVTSDDITSDW